MNSIAIPQELKKVNEIFTENGFKAYLVGGAVRDILRNKEGHDWDIATDATPQQVMKIFRRVIPTGIAHGTVTIHILGKEIEATTFRTDGSYSDGRHPDSIEYAATIEEDLSRRDFTINAIAADLGDGHLVDPFGGQDDIRRRLIRTVGSPLDRFGEDGLRPVRAVRFAGQLGFDIDPETYRALHNPAVLQKTASISVERFRDEWCKMMALDKPSICLKLLEKTGIMDMFIPEFRMCRGCSQSDARGYHDFDVADHIFHAVDGAPKENLAIRLAAFYHDIGKPQTRTVAEVDGLPIIHFHGHEVVSAETASRSLVHLRFPNETVRKVVHLVREHMFRYESCWSDAAVRRFIIRVGLDSFEDLIALHVADIYGKHASPLVEGSPEWNLIAELKSRVEKCVESRDALSLKDLCVTGNDLKEMGIPAGKHLGEILKELFETVTESPEMNDRDKLLSLAVNIWKERFCCD